MSSKQHSLLESPEIQHNEEDKIESEAFKFSGRSRLPENECETKSPKTSKSPHHRRSHSYASVPSGVSSWHNGPAIPELDSWREVETLEKPMSRNLKNAGFTAIVLLFPATYLGLGISVATLHGRPINNPSGLYANDVRQNGTYNALQQTITVAVTLFPVIFALIIGKTMKTAAQYKAEQGTTLLQIEQLIASKTFGSTLFVPLNFKRINALGIVLLSLWLLSPLTTQALQRVFSAKSGLVFTANKDLYYLNTNYGNPGILEAPFSGVEDITETSLNPLFLSQLMQPISNSVVDVYWNPKVPLLKSVASRSSQDSQGGYNVQKPLSASDPTFNGSAVNFWTSSVGIPIEGLPNSESNYETYTRLTIDTSYWTFHCSPWENFAGSDVLTMAGPSPYAFFTNCGVQCIHQIGMNESRLSFSVSMFFLMRSDSNEQGYRKLRFGSRNDGVEVGQYQGSTEPQFTTTACDMRLEQVQADVNCRGKDCEVGRITAAPTDGLERHHPGVARKAFRILSYLSPPQYLTTMIGSSYLERWLSKPGKIVSDASPDLVNWSLFPGEKQVNLSRVSTQDFEHRLGYAFTTFYELALGLAMIPRQLPTLPASDAVMANSRGLYSNTTGIVSRKQVLYNCEWGWFSVLIVSCVVVVAAIGLNAYLQYHVRGPDVLGYISTVTQNNPFMPLPRGGSTMSGIDRALKLADLKVRLQDIDPDGDVGHIALSSIDGEPLRDKRKYW